MWPELRPITSGILIHPAVWPQQTWRHGTKIGGGLRCHFLGGAGSPCNTMWLRCSAYPRTKWHHDLCSRLATIHGPKLGVLFPLFGREQGPHLTQSHGPRSTSVRSGSLIHPAVWPQQKWAKNWGLCPFWGGGAGPHLTKCGRG